MPITKSCTEPIQADHFTSVTPVIRTYDLTVARHQRLGGPTRLKDRLMHGSSRRGVVIRPHLKIEDTLERFIGTQDQAAHLATDVLKASRSTKERAIRSKATANRFRYLDER